MWPFIAEVAQMHITGIRLNPSPTQTSCPGSPHTRSRVKNEAPVLFLEYVRNALATVHDALASITSQSQLERSLYGPWQASPCKKTHVLEHWLHQMTIFSNVDICKEEAQRTLAFLYTDTRMTN